MAHLLGKGASFHQGQISREGGGWSHSQPPRGQPGEGWPPSQGERWGATAASASPGSPPGSLPEEGAADTGAHRADSDTQVAAVLSGLWAKRLVW